MTGIVVSNPQLSIDFEKGFGWQRRREL